MEAVELSAGEEYHELLLLLLFVDDQELSAALLVSPEYQELLGSLDHDEFDHDELVVVVVAAAGFALLVLLP